MFYFFIKLCNRVFQQAVGIRGTMRLKNRSASTFVACETWEIRDPQHFEVRNLPLLSYKPLPPL